MSTFNVKVISRYALTAVGVMVASQSMGMSWGSVQWVVPALGVGHGFGLQAAGDRRDFRLGPDRAGGEAGAHR